MEEKINKLITDIEVIKIKIETFEKKFPCLIHQQIIDDHEDRLRILEDFKAKIIGAFIFGSTIGGVIGSIFVKIIGEMIK